MEDKKCTIGDVEVGCEITTKNSNGMCDKCKAAGWTSDPTEIAQAIAADPLLRDGIQIQSPIQPKDL